MKKTLITILATVLVCACLVGGTLAWLTDKTETVTNTFTIGDINITLTEEEGEVIDGKHSFKMVPGATLTKDPLVTVKGGSEACYLFVKIEEANNANVDLETDKYINYELASGWNALTGVDGVSGVYYREVAASDTDTEFEVLAGNQVTVSGDITKGMITTNPTLSFTAYAVQKDNVANAQTAWGYIPTT